RYRDQDDHPDDNPEGEKNSKKHKSTFGSLCGRADNLIYLNNFLKDQLKCLKDVQEIQMLQQDICLTEIFFLRKGNTEAKKYILSLHKIHATSFTEDDLEELLKRWKCVSKTRSDPDELFTNRKIVDIVRVRHHEVYGHDQIDEVIVRRNNDKFYAFAQSDDFKYLNKNDIEDTYYIVLRRKILCILSLVFRLLALFYENNKNEKRVMDINELHKFSDAALKRVLRKISVINMEARHRIVKISLSNKDKELMALPEEDIEERLKYHLQMRR
ncbi:hypothetical protein Tco_1046773, partial [Tanacetum coccineum]